jgi:sugar-specific transcriptional regulator TrmB
MGKHLNRDTVDKLKRLGFSECEAGAYVALLQAGPASGQGLARHCRIPCSAIHEVLEKLTSRGAAMRLARDEAVEFAPVPVAEFLDRLHREQRETIASLKEELDLGWATPNLELVWNLEGYETIVTRATEMIEQTRTGIYVALSPDIFPTLQPALERATGRGVQAVVYTTVHLDLSGGRVVVSPVSKKALSRIEGLGLILVADGQEALIGEWLTRARVRAYWTRSPLLVLMAERHLIRGGRWRFPFSGDAGPAM